MNQRYQNTATGGTKSPILSTNHPDEDLHGFINDKEWNLKEAHAAQKNAEYHEKRTNAAIARGDLSAAKDHESSAARYRKQEQEHIKSAQKSTK